MLRGHVHAPPPFFSDRYGKRNTMYLVPFFVLLEGRKRLCEEAWHNSFPEIPSAVDRVHTKARIQSDRRAQGKVVADFPIRVLSTKLVSALQLPVHCCTRYPLTVGVELRESRPSCNGVFTKFSPEYWGSLHIPF